MAAGWNVAETQRSDWGDFQNSAFPALPHPYECSPHRPSSLLCILMVPTQGWEGCILEIFEL